MDPQHNSNGNWIPLYSQGKYIPSLYAKAIF